MIRNRLKVLLAIKNLTAHQVFLDTGIAKSTLSAIVNNQTEKISLDVLDKICTYLEISPGDFFEHIPGELSVFIVAADWMKSLNDLVLGKFPIEVKFKKKHNDFEFKMSCETVVVGKEKNKITAVRILVRDLSKNPIKLVDFLKNSFSDELYEAALSQIRLKIEEFIKNMDPEDGTKVNVLFKDKDF